MPRIYSVNIGGAGGGGSGVLVQRAGSEAIPISTQTMPVTFSSPMGDTLYAVTISIFNDTDADPIYLSVVGVDKQLTDFTVTFNAPTDTGNYYIDYMITAYA